MLDSQSSKIFIFYVICIQGHKLYVLNISYMRAYQICEKEMTC